MDNTVEIYEAEKELREKRLAVYAEAIQEKVQKDSEQVIKELVEEKIPSEKDAAGDGRYNRSKSI